MNIVITTLSLGKNYTKDYTLRMIEDVLRLTEIDMYITTDCADIIQEAYRHNPRIKINNVDRNNLHIRLPIGKQKASTDFNFNMRYLCLEHVQDLQDTLVIFTDCDNSFDWWDKEIIEEYLYTQIKQGYDFFGPRTDFKFKYVLNTFTTKCLPLLQQNAEPNYEDCTIFWHKLFNYDLINLTNNTIDNYIDHPWEKAGLPAEYLLLFYNTEDKLRKMTAQWKYFHDYLVHREFTYGTWAEGFEIGVSAYLAGFVDMDISFSHHIWSKVFTPNGYKTGPRGGIVHGTEQ